MTATPDAPSQTNSPAGIVVSDACSAPPLTGEAIQSGQWNNMETAPKDGREVWIWIRHPYYYYAAESGIEEMYEDAVRAHWIDHNGGGWTWAGLYGRQVAWAPISQNTD